jgi:predicted RNase H-like nuclease (RuvC/YqgF family)
MKAEKPNKPKLEFYCDKPACFAHYVANKKIKTAEKPKLGSGMTKTGIYINEKIASNWKSKYAKACNAYIQKNFNEMNNEIRQLNESLIRMDADAEKMLAEKDSTITHLEDNIIIPLQKRIIELEKENEKLKRMYENCKRLIRKEVL